LKEWDGREVQFANKNPTKATRPKGHSGKSRGGKEHYINSSSTHCEPHCSYSKGIPLQATNGVVWGGGGGGVVDWTTAKSFQRGTQRTWTAKKQKKRRTPAFELKRRKLTMTKDQEKSKHLGAQGERGVSVRRAGNSKTIYQTSTYSPGYKESN